MSRKIRSALAVAIGAATIAALPAAASAAEGKSPAIAAYCNSSHGKESKALALKAWQTYGAAYYQAKAAGNEQAAAIYWKHAVYFMQAYYWFVYVCA